MIETYKTRVATAKFIVRWLYYLSKLHFLLVLSNNVFKQVLSIAEFTEPGKLNLIETSFADAFL